MAVSTEARVPMLDLGRELDEIGNEIGFAMQRVMRSGQFILGPEVEAFEHEAAALLGVTHAIGVNSGTDALVIALRALGVGPGHEVITTPFTFTATTEAILSVGAEPVFVDVEDRTFNIDPEKVRAAITERTKAVLPVHLFGRPASLPEIVAIAHEFDLKIVEDAAQAFGAWVWTDVERSPTDREANPRRSRRRVGTVGQAGAFSFYPTKNLNAYGDAGMVVTNDDAVAESMRMLRNHGAPSNDRFGSQTIGYNSRLDALQAAILRVKLPYVDRWNEIRRARAHEYERFLMDAAWIRLPEIAEGHVFHQYTVRIAEGVRDRVARNMASQGVSSSVFYPTVATMGCPFRPADIGNALRATREVLSLPIHPWLSSDQVSRVAEILVASY